MEKQSEEMQTTGEHACFDMFCRVSKEKLKKKGDNCWGK